MSPSKLSRRQRGQEKIKKRREGWKKDRRVLTTACFAATASDSVTVMIKKNVMKYYFAFEQCCSLVSDDNKQSRANMLRSGQKAWNNTERGFFHGARQSHTLFCLKNGMTAISLLHVFRSNIISKWFSNKYECYIFPEQRNSQEERKAAGRDLREALKHES